MALTLLGRSNPLASSTEQLRILGQPASSPPFDFRLDQAGLFPLRATGISVLQINVGKLCNQTCHHCHVDAGPDRIESMSRETAEQCMAALAATDIPTVDLTGGAPELNDHFEDFVKEARRLGKHVMVRHNLTVTLDPHPVNGKNMEYLPGPDDVVEVTDHFDGTGAQTSYPLNYAINQGTAPPTATVTRGGSPVVYPVGVYGVDTMGWTYDASQNRIVHDTAQDPPILGVSDDLDVTYVPGFPQFLYVEDATLRANDGLCNP